MAAVVIHEHKILIVRRPQDKILGGFWVFPGGKIEEGEEPEEALSRELREELSLNLKDFIYLDKASHDYPSGRIHIRFYASRVKDATVDPEPGEVADFRWIHPEELDQYTFPPADAGVLKRLMKQGVPA